MNLVTYHLDREGAERLLFLIHGWSAEQHHLAAYIPLIDPDERVTAICPRSIHDLPDGDGASWYERTEAGPDSTSFVQARDALIELIATEADRAGIPPQRCAVGGFSQGGFLAQAVVGAPAPATMRACGPCAAVWPRSTGWRSTSAPGDRRPALVQYGRRDAIIPAERTKAVATALEAAGWDCRVEGYDMAHSQTVEMMIDARQWLATVTARAMPGGRAGRSR
ncbi:MAG: hypothetical protein GY929_00655 [Actinomycetia bacterium]|nr:hypothetical protein [Actinomycetes bacterium]MCP5024768.1 hypothetical protein [Actinomycetes bacterium]